MFKVGPSKIHGKGVISTKNIKKGTKIGTPLYLFMYVFPVIVEGLGRKINHSWDANSHLVRDGNTWHLYASQNIKKNQEITLDYNQTPWFIDGPKNSYL